MDDIDTEQFIEEIRKRRAIWDSSSENYKNRELKRSQWAEVSTVLYPEFVALDTSDKIRTIMELQAKWKHIRDSYVRSLRLKRKSGHRGRVPKCYVYSRQLDFLRPITTSRQTECSPQPEVIIHDLDDDEYDDDVIQEPEEVDGGGVAVVDEAGAAGVVEVGVSVDGVGVCDGAGGAIGVSADTAVLGEVHCGGDDEGGIEVHSLTGQPDVEDKTENGEPSRKYSTSSTQRKRRRTESVEQNVRNYIDSYDRERMDRRPEDPTCDDMDFFRSLLPLIQLLPLYERMKFRMDIMRIGLEYFEKSRASAQYSE